MAKGASGAGAAANASVKVKNDAGSDTVAAAERAVETAKQQLAWAELALEQARKENG